MIAVADMVQSLAERGGTRRLTKPRMDSPRSSNRDGLDVGTAPNRTWSAASQTCDAVHFTARRL